MVGGRFVAGAGPGRWLCKGCGERLGGSLATVVRLSGPAERRFIRPVKTLVRLNSSDGAGISLKSRSRDDVVDATTNGPPRAIAQRCWRDPYSLVQGLAERIGADAVTTLSQLGANTANRWGTGWDYAHRSAHFRGQRGTPETTPEPIGGQMVAGSNPVSPTEENAH
jgi:hypothetical protein